MICCSTELLHAINITPVTDLAAALQCTVRALKKHLHLAFVCLRCPLLCRMDIQPGQDVLQAFFAECEAKLVHFAPQNISNMLWACATLTVSPGESSVSTLCMLIMHAAAHQKSFHKTSILCYSPSVSESAVWSHLVSNIPFSIHPAGRKFLTTVTIVSLQQLRMFTPQAVKDTLWAMATMGYTPSKPFLQGAADICLYLIAQFNPQNIANAIWAFAKFSFNPGRFVADHAVC